MESKSIERFFLDTLLKIVISGVALILLTDLILYPQDKLSILLDSVILIAAIASFAIRKTYKTVAVFIVTGVVLAAMVYQCVKVPVNTTVSLSIILVVGFIFSVMLKGRMMWVMHTLTFLVIHSIFLIQVSTPALRYTPDVNDILTIAITYSILYFILTYSTAVLKAAYDNLNANLTSLNAHLEQAVKERTDKIVLQNELLLKYS